jgi:hypothetical protein
LKTVRLAAAGSLWLASAGAAAYSCRFRPAAVVYPALLTAAGAVTAALLAERMMARADEQAVTAVLAGLELDRKIHEPGPGLRVVDGGGGRLPGCAV